MLDSNKKSSSDPEQLSDIVEILDGVDLRVLALTRH